VSSDDVMCENLRKKCWKETAFDIFMEEEEEDCGGRSESPALFCWYWRALTVWGNTS